MARPPDADELTARLYTTGPDDFVKVRSEGARALKAAGDTDAAALFAKLPKPSVSAWAVNLLAAQRQTLIDELVARGNELRAAHTGGGAATEIRAAQRARQDAIRVATDAAAELARRPLSEGHRAEIAATLEAASSDGAAADEVRAARLVRPLAAPTGFGTFGGLTAIPGGRSSRRGEPAGARRSKQAAADAAADEEAKLARSTILRADADAALGEAESATAAVADLGDRVAAVEAQREQLAAELQRVDNELTSARRELRDAERAATTAVRKATRAAARAETAESSTP